MFLSVPVFAFVAMPARLLRQYIIWLIKEINEGDLATAVFQHDPEYEQLRDYMSIAGLSYEKNGIIHLAKMKMSLQIPMETIEYLMHFNPEEMKEYLVFLDDMLLPELTHRTISEAHKRYWIDRGLDYHNVTVE